MAPDLKNVLERFEKTISENEKAGVTSGSYLTQVASRRQAHGSKIAMKAAGRPRSSDSPFGTCTSSRSRNLSPDSKIPSDATVNTHASSTGSTHDDPFGSLNFRHSRHDDDPFYEGPEFVDDFEGSFGEFEFDHDEFGDDDTFSNADHSHNSSSSLTFGNDQPSSSRAAAAAKWQLSGMRQTLAPKLVVEDDDGFSVHDDASVYSRGSVTLKRSTRDTQTTSERKQTSRRPSTTGMVRRVKATIEDQQTHPSDLVRRASQRNGGAPPSTSRRLPPRTSSKDKECSAATPPPRPRARRSTVESRREKRRERVQSETVSEQRSSALPGAAASSSEQ